ncbi:MAG: YeiH family protein [Polyangiaceae bacterium]
MALALLLGIALALVFGNPWPRATKKIASTALFAGVAGLGAGLGLRALAEVGMQGIFGTVLGIAACLTTGYLLSRVVRLEAKVALLVTVGTAICGGSAIAAIAPVVRAKDEEMSLALAVVFVLNGIALVVFPAIGHAAGMSGHQFGWWAAVAIHDTSSVVGAALRFGNGAVDLAVPLKLTRALYIVPVALLASSRLASGSATDNRDRKAPRPWLALAFLAVSAIFSFVPALASIRAPVIDVSRFAMGVALFFIGTSLTRSALANVSARVLAFGATLWIAMATSTLAAILLFVSP